MSSPKRKFLTTVPRKSSAIFLLGVFLLFSTIGLANDMTQMGRQPVLRLVLVECPNMPLGIVPSGEFTTSEATVEGGTLFALYTDGLLETANKAGEEFGMNRLKAELQKHGTESLDAICRSIQESVAHHGGQFDDQSILLIRKT